MKSSPRSAPTRLRRILLLGLVLLLAAGCATMSRPKLGLGGTDDNLPRVGR